jgi:multidrug efflux pump subunit AcrB
MDIAEFAITKKVTTWLLVAILVFGGLSAYQEMGKLEDPNFTIKQAKIVTDYPGATPEQVDREVTYHIEEAMQQLGQLKRLKKTISREGQSEVEIEFKDGYYQEDMPNIYDEVRRKVKDMEHKLPPGAGKPRVIDDFADVFGIYLALTGEGYSYRDLKDTAEELKKQLVLLAGVRKVQLGGEILEEVVVEISRTQLAELGISPSRIGRVLTSQNVVSDAGRLRVGDDYISIWPTGEFKSVAEIKDVLISSDERKLIRLGDIAQVRRVYQEIPSTFMFQNGKPAVTLAVSALPGENVVAIGELIEQKLAELQNIIPLGMEIDDIYNQPKEVEKSVSGFVTSVVQALVIVVAVLLVFMGIKVGLIIGAVLLITVAGTLWLMNIFGIELQRVSLGALIIALGMLVDNAIVVSEGMLIRIKGGMDPVKAGSEVVGQTNMALLGGTVIGILAFSGVGLSDNNTGEFARSLFYVITISLMLSWVTAITVTPMLCALLLKADPNASNEDDAYSGKGFQIFRRMVQASIRFRYLTLGMAFAVFAAGLWGFGQIKQGFFPFASTPIFFVDIWEVEGTDIRQTREDTLRLSNFIRTLDGVEKTSAVVGEGLTRFTLVYEPESPFSAYSQILVRTEDREQIAEIQDKIKAFMDAELPDTEPKIKNMRIGPGRDAKIEARFAGPDPEVLRQLSEQAQAIMRADPETVEVRDDWRQPVKKIRPVFKEQVGRELGITRDDLAASLQSATEGEQVGIYRDGIRLLPILLRSPENERQDVGKLQDIQVWSPVLDSAVPVSQVVDRFETIFENSMVRSRNRKWTIIASCNPSGELADPLFARLRPQLEAIPLPPGYMLDWGGEYEDSVEAQDALFKQLPSGFLLMIIVTVLLFSSIRQPLIIWLVVPFAVIGISAGLLSFDGSFDFMALLGSLALIGLMIKNSIVLVEEIDLQIAQGKAPLTGVLDATVSRMRPVMMAATTTILGLIPLLSDVFFVNMSITMMAGLGVATILTLIIIPTWYATMFRIPNDKDA